MALESGGRSVPFEYIEMKFCEKFGISPLEFARLPKRKVDKYLQMMNIESQLRK